MKWRPSSSAPPSDPVEVSGRVTQGGEPYAQAMVNWLPASTGVQEKMKFTATDADGRYPPHLDEAGDYVIGVAKLPGGARSRSRWSSRSVEKAPRPSAGTSRSPGAPWPAASSADGEPRRHGSR